MPMFVISYKDVLLFLWFGCWRRGARKDRGFGTVPLKCLALMKNRRRDESSIPTVPKATQGTDSQSQTQIKQALCSRNQLPILNGTVYAEGRVSRFSTSFQGSWKNLEHIFILKWIVKIEFRVHATKVSCNMWSCLSLFHPPLLFFKKPKIAFQPPALASIMKYVERPTNPCHGNRELEGIGKQDKLPAVVGKNHGWDSCAMIPVVGAVYKSLVRIMFSPSPDTSPRPLLCHWWFWNYNHPDFSSRLKHRFKF